MRMIYSRYLTDDGSLGRPASLFEIEDPGDFDTLYRYILDSGYYGSVYFDTEIGYRPDQVVSHFFCVSEIIRHLGPRRVLELGCGRGDVLYLLQRSGIDVHGIDLSPHVVEHSWPSLRPYLSCGDLRAVLGDLASRPEARFDTICGFDIWEHLPPGELDSYLDAALAVASEDALFYFIVPAFGADVVFGEQFPLEFEENRDAFDRREPFRFLLSDAYRGGVPSLGHLIWAHTDWWLERFAAHGLVREPALERPFHHFLDPLVPHSVRSFYLFRRDTEAAAARTGQLVGRPYDRRAFTGSAVHLVGGIGGLGKTPVRFDGPLRRRFLRSWRDRVALLADDRRRRLTGRWPGRLRRPERLRRGRTPADSRT